MALGPAVAEIIRPVETWKSRDYSPKIALRHSLGNLLEP